MNKKETALERMKRINLEKLLNKKEILKSEKVDSTDLEIRSLKLLKAEKEGTVDMEKVHIFYHPWKTDMDVNFGIAELLEDMNW